jgi:hypothetical protein
MIHLFPIVTLLTSIVVYLVRSVATISIFALLDSSQFAQRSKAFTKSKGCSEVLIVLWGFETRVMP